MNKKIILSAVLLSSFFIFSSFSPKGELHWYQFNEGYKKAMKEKKIALIDTYTDWCGWCKRMDRDTYGDASIIEKINKSFIPIKFNPEIKDGKYELDGKTYSGPELHAIISNHQQSGYPTTYFVLTKKNRILVTVGYENPQQFSATLDNMIKESQN